MSAETQMGCCLFLRRPSSLSRIGYRPLSPDGGESTVTVVVGKERREFSVDPFVLDKAPFRLLLEMMRDKGQSRERSRRKDVIFVDVDAILFEHMLWLVYNNESSSSTLFQFNLEEIIEFYSQDS